VITGEMVQQIFASEQAANQIISETDQQL
jgi:hypothetical protein